MSISKKAGSDGRFVQIEFFRLARDIANADGTTTVAHDVELEGAEIFRTLSIQRRSWPRAKWRNMSQWSKLLRRWLVKKVKCERQVFFRAWQFGLLCQANNAALCTVPDIIDLDHVTWPFRRQACFNERRSHDSHDDGKTGSSRPSSSNSGTMKALVYLGAGEESPAGASKTANRRRPRTRSSR